LALLVATTAFAWGQTSQQPQPQAQQAQNQPTSDQRGTEQAPFIVKAAPKSEAEAAADAKEREEKSRLDRQLVKYTLYLAIIALLQFGALIAQAVFVAWTIVHGRRVERAYVSGGGAFLEIRGIDAKTGEPTSQMTDTFQLTVDNYGKTPARVFNVKLGFVTQPTFPPFIYVRNELLSAVIPPNAEGRFTPVRLRRNQIAGDTIFGRFTYETVFRRRFRLPRRQHHAGFILHITPTLGVEPINAPRAYTDWN
jgi:hypothetical protein